MPDPDQTLDQLKYDLEKQKFDFDRLKYERDNTFFNKNFGVIITAIISAATVFVSVSQIIISTNYNNSQLTNAQVKADRDFAFDLAKFMLAQREDINTSDLNKARYIRNTVIAFFPSEYGARIAKSMRDLSDDKDIKAAWADAAEYAQTVSVPPTKTTRVQGTYDVDKLAKEFVELSVSTKIEKVRIILEQAQKFGITDKNDVAIFLAIIFYNTKFLQELDENFNYSAERLQQIWPTRFQSLSDAQKVAGKPEAIADSIYGGRMGNTKPGDGYKYRGRGYLTITGRNSYKMVGIQLNVDLEADPDKLLDPTNDARAAAYLFARETEGARNAGKLDLLTAIRTLNGGINGLSEMQSISERIQKT
jgi:putative chitinase